MYSLPICLDILPEHVLQLHAWLVNVTYILSKTVITQNEIDDCEVQMVKFVAKYEEHYGEWAMKFNVHLAEHMSESIRQTGPAWATSTVPFEGKNHGLASSINGSKGIEKQIAKKHLKMLTFKTNAMETLPLVVQNYCNEVFGEKVVDKSDEITYVKKDNGCDVSNKTIERFEMIKYHGWILTTVNYKHAECQFIDSTIKLKNGSFCKILEIIRINSMCQFKVEMLRVKRLCVGELQLTHIWEVIGTRELYISPKEMQEKVVIIHVNNQSFVCELPNFIEAD